MKHMLKTWVDVMIHPNKNTFDNLTDNAEATRKIAIVWLAMGVLLAAVVKGLSSFVSESIFRSYVGPRQVLAITLFHLSPYARDGALINFIGLPLVGGLVAFSSFLIGAPIILSLGAYFIAGLAKRLGGGGDFGKQLYAFACFIPGLMILANAFGVVPPLKACFVPLLWIYAIILSIQAVRSVQGLSIASALVVVLIPFIIITIVVILINLSGLFVAIPA